MMFTIVMTPQIDNLNDTKQINTQHIRQKVSALKEHMFNFTLTTGKQEDKTNVWVWGSDHERTTSPFPRKANLLTSSSIC